jgi:phosphoglucomutase
LTGELGTPYCARTDIPTTAGQKAAFRTLTSESVDVRQLAGEPVVAVLTRAPGNGADIGGPNAVTRHGWFAVRPSGTEDVCKIYAESLRGEEHLHRIQDEARRVLESLFAAAGA